jgi:hypothetical protein
MKSITAVEKAREVEGNAALLEALTDWEQLKALFPSDLEESAVQSKALRRHRAIMSASDLLRICLMYAVSDWSFRLLGAWCTMLNICHVSHVALWHRVGQSHQWLSHLVMQVLNERVRLSPQAGVRLRIMDGTVISQPGSIGTDWRLHLSIDLGQMRLDSIELTDASGGESLERGTWRPGEIVLADRGFAFARGLGAVLDAGASLIVRPTWQNLPLYEDDGDRFDLPAWLRRAVEPTATPQEIALYLPTPQGTFPVRLVAVALPTEAAARARQRAYQAAKKKGRQPDARTLIAAGFLFVLTNLPQDTWSAHQVLTLYRARWQIEIAIKRLKSICQLDHLRAKEPQLVQSYLLAKLLAALLLEHLFQHIEHQQPFWFVSVIRPLSRWRLSILLWDQLLLLIKGLIHLATIFRALPLLGRYLRNSPRQRTQQDVRVRNFLTTHFLLNPLS